MIPELGNFALILALLLAITQVIFPIVGAARGIPSWIALARPVVQGQFVFVVIAFGCLAYSFVNNDFSVLNVVQNSNSKLPVQYRFAATWGSHEGSLLLWMLMLASWSVAVSVFSRHLPDDMVARVLGVMGVISVGFLLFMLFTSNPFDRIFPAAFEGSDLNTLLQDAGMVVHPPMLYMGYVGFSLAYSNAIGVLLAGRNQSNWAKYLRPWVILSWTFLTTGIALGSWWAYRELGWGGYWYWDPVENASLMPWLFGTALVHSLITTQREKILESQSIILCLVTFILTMIGTFIVRSGAITSVHSFATDPTRGAFILLIISFLFLFGLFIYSIKAKKLRKSRKFKLFSNVTLILANIFLLIAAGLIVVFGTLYPIFLELFTGIHISVGAPYYNKIISPIAITLVILCILGSQMSWRTLRIKHLIISNIAPLVLSILCGSLIIFTFEINGVLPIISIISSTLLIVSIIEQNSKNFGRIDARYLGVTLSHIGFGLLVLSIAVNSAAKTEHEFSLEPGEKIVFKGYDVILKSVYFVKGKNFVSKRADISIDDPKYNEEITTVSPEIRFFPIEKQQTVESSIYHHPLYDLYFVMGDEFGNKTQFKVFYQPFVGLLWLSCFLISIGGIFSIAYIANRRIRFI